MNRLVVAVYVVLAVGAGYAQMFSFSEEVGPGRIDWAERVVRVTGTGRASPTESPAAARPKSLIAAREDAKQAMFEAIYEISVTSSTKVKDLVKSDPSLRQFIESMAKYFREVGTPVYVGDQTQVTLEFLIGGEFLRAILPPTGSKIGAQVSSLYTCPKCGQPWPAGAAVPPDVMTQSGIDPTRYSFTGLIVDCRGLGMKNFTVAPRVLNEKGDEVYGPAWVGREDALRDWIVMYARSVDEAATARVGAVPFLVRALRTAGNNNADVVISDADARILTATEANMKLMEYCRVVFIVS